MLCYKDMTFCPFSSNCVKGEGCSRALTTEILEAAEKWWGEVGAPVCAFSAEPQCFEQVKEEDQRLKK